MFTRITVIVAIIWVVLAGGLGMAMRRVQGGKSQGAGLASGTPMLEAGDAGAKKPGLDEGEAGLPGTGSAPVGNPEIKLPDPDMKTGPALPAPDAKTEPAVPAAPAKTSADAPGEGAAKPDAPKDPAKPDAPKPEAPKAETPDEPKPPAEAAKPDAPKGDEAKDAPKSEEPKPDAATSDAEKPAEADKK